MKNSFRARHNVGFVALLKTCLLFMCCAAYSGTFNQWQTSHTKHKTGTDILTSDNHYIYHSLNEGIHQVVSLNLDTKEEKILFTSAEEVNSMSSIFYELASGQVLMEIRYVGDNSGIQLLQSDGEQSFEALTDRQIRLINRPLVNGHYFYYDNNKLMWTDGLNTQSQVLEANEVAAPLCAFDMEHVVFAKGLDVYSDIYQHEQGNVLHILPGYSVDGNRIHANVASSCLVKVKGSDEQYRIAHIHKNGDAELTNRNDNKYEVFNGNFVAIAAPTAALLSPFIQLLDGQTLNVIRGISYNSNELVDIFLAADRIIYSQKESQGSQTQISRLDSEFNLIGTSFVVDGYLASTRIEDFFLRNGKVITAENLDENKGIIFEGSNITYNPRSDYFLADTSGDSGFAYPDSTAVYVYEDKPAIGPMLSGAWLDPSMPNQGASINPGVRQDGSHYVFLTFYLFREGQPLWLAGIADYKLGKNEMTILLSEYQGANYLDFENTPERTTFGEITLNVSSCNTIDARVEYDGAAVDLDWTRLDDASFSSRCN
ncbi:hypothetical protein [Marinicella rhabdoformis]|uniref:hypothetical protein n=1 Tax=Marinicella rhabdoformis TaxID=2580566 RepID=UPI0012AEB803|nr:hypothetical protein [Marinicella rhabdoformis]